MHIKIIVIPLHCESKTRERVKTKYSTKSLQVMRYFELSIESYKELKKGFKTIDKITLVFSSLYDAKKSLVKTARGYRDKGYKFTHFRNRYSFTSIILDGEKHNIYMTISEIYTHDYIYDFSDFIK